MDDNTAVVLIAIGFFIVMISAMWVRVILERMNKK